MSQSDQAVLQFKEKAEKVSVQALDVATIQEAIDYAIDVCDKKDFCQILIPDAGEKPRSAGEDLPRATVKTIAAPGLAPELFNELETKAKAKGFKIIRDNVREHMAGIDVTLCVGRFGIAETGSSVLSTSNEDEQIASMICETFVLALSKSMIFPTLEDCAEELQKLTSQDAAYTAFITGCSRTSDIERVLTLGVHGPIEMHVALLEA